MDRPLIFHFAKLRHKMFVDRTTGRTNEKGWTKRHLNPRNPVRRCASRYACAVTIALRLLRLEAPTSQGQKLAGESIDLQRYTDLSTKCGNHDQCLVRHEDGRTMGIRAHSRICCLVTKVVPIISASLIRPALQWRSIPIVSDSRRPKTTSKGAWNDDQSDFSGMDSRWKQSRLSYSA
jgi:hypothetical protein